MKRILIFSLAYFPHVGGAEVAIKEITDRIHDVEFCMITLRFNSTEARREKIGNVLVYRVGFGSTYISKILFVPLAALTALRLNRVDRFDAAWAMMSYMLFPLVLLRLCGVRLPYVLTLQEGDPFERVYRRWFILPFRPLISVGFRHALVVQTISTYLSGWARTMGFKGPLEVIPNGVDVARFAGVPTPHSGIVLITSSRLVHKNAIDDVIRALPMLPDIRFVICGTGPEETALRKLARQLKVEDRVEFKGHVDHAQLPALLHAADIFVRPSRSEGMGNSFIEAMATGLPVIATQEGGIADFLFDAKRNPERQATGWAIDSNSPGQISEAVRGILENPAQTKKIIESANTVVLEKYDWDDIAKKMLVAVFSRV